MAKTFHEKLDEARTAQRSVAERREEDHMADIRLDLAALLLGSALVVKVIQRKPGWQPVAGALFISAFCLSLARVLSRQT